MTWLSTIKTVSVGIAVGGILLVTGAEAQQNSVRQAVTAAYDAFNAALSARDIETMEQLWVHEPGVVSANPRDKDVNVGWDAVQKNWETTFAFWGSDFKVIRRGEPQIGIAQPIAWCISIADVQGRRPDGQSLSFQVIATDVFQNRGDRWLMVSHHASRIPD